MITFRPIPSWPYPNTRNRRGSYTFKAGWEDTLGRLRYELVQVRASDAVIGIVASGDVQRRDGMLRADLRPLHPGVEVSFTMPRPGAKGETMRVVYATDVCTLWNHNVRSIALGLEALRAVDRYGITRRGEQYAGFAALPAGGPDAEQGERLVRAAGGIREALFKHHPDHGGRAEDFAHVQAYRQQREGAA